MSISIVHKYWQEDNHDHFYTTNVGEIGTTQVGHKGNHGYKYEGEAFTVFNHHHAGLHPVYRYYHEHHHDHHYTANPNEIGKHHAGEVGNHGYKCEGILGYVSDVEFPGSVPIYRYYQDGTHDHFYTTNAAEIGTTHVGQKGNHGYSCEGVLGYAYPAQHHLASVHRYWDAQHHDHFYTSNHAELGGGGQGYTAEGTPFHVFNHHHHGLVPVYRYWHPHHHDHFYTANAGEIGTTQVGHEGSHGYKCEGILGYVSQTHFHGSLPVHRYWHEGHHDHLYTTDVGEIGTVNAGQVGNHGYKYEGILGYVPHH
jgi:hypothetical protein